MGLMSPQELEMDWASPNGRLLIVSQAFPERSMRARTVQKPISDARTAAYVILSIGSGPGGRSFKFSRPDHLLKM
jgi:hypothetical protein